MEEEGPSVEVAAADTSSHKTSFDDGCSLLTIPPHASLRDSKASGRLQIRRVFGAAAADDSVEILQLAGGSSNKTNNNVKLAMSKSSATRTAIRPLKHELPPQHRNNENSKISSGQESTRSGSSGGDDDDSLGTLRLTHRLPQLEESVVSSSSQVANKTAAAETEKDAESGEIRRTLTASVRSMTSSSSSICDSDGLEVMIPDNLKTASPRRRCWGCCCWNRKSVWITIGVMLLAVIVTAIALTLVSKRQARSPSSDFAALGGSAGAPRPDGSPPSSNAQQPSKTTDSPVSVPPPTGSPVQLVAVPATTSIPSGSPVDVPTSAPTASPVNVPTSAPTGSPSAVERTTETPTQNPTSMEVVDANDGGVAGINVEPFEVDGSETPVTYSPGRLTKLQNGVLLSEGLNSRVLARSGEPVKYSGGGSSVNNFHVLPDGAACFADTRSFNPGGWIYVSNSEARVIGTGGVGAITFNGRGDVVDYNMVLENTSWNCAGGKTPWNTWISCEEYPLGRIWEVDPTGERPARQITLGSDDNGGPGWYESFAYDIRRRDKPDFFVTEDDLNGPLRKFTPTNPNWEDPWNILHGSGTTRYLVLKPSDNQNLTGTFLWTRSERGSRMSAEWHYPHAEGIDVHGSELFFISKALQSMFILDLDGDQYVRQPINHGLFQGTPDQIVRILGDEEDSLLYFTEDTRHNRSAGVHARNAQGDFFTIMEGIDIVGETAGLAFSPDLTKMYVAWQLGMLFEVWREDGYPFAAETLSVQYHSAG